MTQYDDDLRSLLAEGRLLDRENEERARADEAREAEADDGGAPDDPTRPADPPSWARAWRRELTDPPAEPTAAVATRQRGRATETLQATWIDPEETPFVPVPRPGKAIPARLFSFLVTGLGLGLLAWLIVPEVSFRITNVDKVTVRQGVLTAQAVPLAPTSPATVEVLWVDAGHLPSGVLPAGTPVARLRSSTTDAFGSNAIDLTVPFDARFASVDTLEGAVTQPGTPVATVYDPEKMYVIVTVDASTLDLLRRGMRAELKSPLLAKPVAGTVVAAVPLLGTDRDPATSSRVNVRIQPEDGRITDLVPGIRFDATIDLDSAPAGAQPLVFTAADDTIPGSDTAAAGGG